jgi:hypothetical protein
MSPQKPRIHREFLIRFWERRATLASGIAINRQQKEGEATIASPHFCDLR